MIYVLSKEQEMGKGGGVALLVRNEVKSIAKSDIGSEGIESLWVELRNRKGKKTLMGVMYRLPSNSQGVGQKINQEIEKTFKKGNITIIMGDFNMQVDWENQVVDPKKKNLWNI